MATKYGLFAALVTGWAVLSGSANAATQAQGLSHQTVISQSDAYRASRQGQYFIVELLTPHQVISTSSYNGGQSENIRYLVNHQSMEAKGDNQRFMAQISQSRESYHTTIAKRLAINPNEMALMGTAANMQQMASVSNSFKDLTVTVFATAGVKNNALRAGDNTRWYQQIDGQKVSNKKVQPTPRVPKKNKAVPQQTQPKTDHQGTINIMVLVNKAVSHGAQQKIAMLATEAKSAALSELSIGSGQSSHLATGTGTDQLIIASPISLDSPALPSASGHLKLGELVGKTVKKAVLDALLWQNKMDAVQHHNVLHALARFGLSKNRLLEHLQTHLPSSEYDLAEQNINALINDARLSASAYAYASVLDKWQYQALPVAIQAEVFRDQAAQIAVALSAKPQHWPTFWQQLELPPAALKQQATQHEQQQAFIELFTHALALGWQYKWR
ncbi:adenosylcobinamide amidohydrolase [Catenovulum sp. SM1970]|uniref:adenosylcobinamide amidohydrolase n=1 Tax=Marinifaba aquimaris TaxID=2741323 RepID=UPI001573385F|nr:adenosylcobinamide amidohydrolase [Marinifaba aquimaris]NTS76303.1 adenosylcobinamide amidohydrolase [Marinifaba aquimaris]